MAMLSLNTNLMASNAARNLSAHYDRLSKSVRRLSSGLRVGTAADDAAGLAIRELMRGEIASLNQGIHNASDAISLIQTADGALSIIDEKLIRMKELAEQAATGTYSSDQRLMINSEFQAMALEINRIAMATDFNGVKLLDGSLSGQHDGSGLASSGAMKIHFGSGNDSAEDYYYIDIPSCTVHSLLGISPGFVGLPNWEGAVIDYQNNTIVLNIPNRQSGVGNNSPAGMPGMPGMDFYALPVGLKNVVIESGSTKVQNYAHKPHVNLFTKSGQQLTGVDPGGTHVTKNGVTRPGSDWWNGFAPLDVINAGVTQGIFDQSAVYDGSSIVKNQGDTVSVGASTITMVTDMTDDTSQNNEIISISEVTDDLVFLIGGHTGPGSSNCDYYYLKITAEFDPALLRQAQNMESLSIATQEKAQNMLEHIDIGIINKDKIRAHLGAMQNRLENTISNLQIQAENLQASESRISDVDVSQEMAEFVRNQVLTQASVAMLAQANSLPQMALSLIG